MSIILFARDEKVKHKHPHAPSRTSKCKKMPPREVFVRETSLDDKAVLPTERAD